MIKFILPLLLLTLTFSIMNQNSPCPIQSQVGSVISTKISVSQISQSLVPMDPEEDVQCYNYSLPYQFTAYPQIAVAIHDFDGEKSNHLFLSIKVLPTESLSFISFLIRTPWRYTYWNNVQFSFLAEDRRDIESAYYQIDSGKLGGCQVGKSINVLLPLKDIGISSQFIEHSVFLSGFSITSKKFAYREYSPLQIQIANTKTNSSGINLVISVTTISQVHEVHVSYVAWQAVSTLSIISGAYRYQKSFGISMSHTPTSNIERNYARIYGITGFIMKNNQQDYHFRTVWTGSKFHFDLDENTPSTIYLSFQYIFFLGSECSDCPGYPLSYNNKCVQYCPLNTYATSENVCINCGEGHEWNGKSCVKQCPTGQTLNVRNNQCECPAGLFWNEKRCITCVGGKKFNFLSKQCQCPGTSKWNGFGCVNLPDCVNGKEWNIFSFSCQCPYQFYWNGTYCEKKVQCTGGQYRNMNNRCQCPQGTYLQHGWCQDTGCVGGQIWNGSSCACESDYHFNGSLCIICINGQVWNPRSLACNCQKNYTWNGNYCEQRIICSGSRVWNTVFQQCICPEGHFWNGVTCMFQQDCCCGKKWNTDTFECQCPNHFHWDGSVCVSCINGKVWDSRTKKCNCQLGTQWNGQFCVVIQECFGGMLWNQNTWSCQCPSTAVWNGNFCVANPCIGGQIWDNSLRRCKCINSKVFKNNVCTPPQIACPYNKIWDNTIYACKCSSNTFDNGTNCLPIPICQNNKIYNPLNNKCECGYGLVWLQNFQQCGDPTCPAQKRWNGEGCVDIACPPNSYYSGFQCIHPSPEDKCQSWEYFDGQSCVYQEGTCPSGTEWNGQTCTPKNSVCPNGFYGYNNYCKPLPQKCIPPTTWSGNKCVSKANSCPHGTYLRNGNCIPYLPCQNNQIWNNEMIKCVCPSGTEWNGQQCLGCSGGKIWNPFEGCKCPTGSFFIGSRCQIIKQQRCLTVPGAFWDGFQCLCHEGLQNKGLACLCEGVMRGNLCDRCAHRPNSEWKYGFCQCKQGYTLYKTECLSSGVKGEDTESDCNVGTFYDFQQRRCLPCPSGCLSCKSSYACSQCKPQFSYDANSELCIEHCGDGKRFVSECDDGNNKNGDGCSEDCKLESGYVCRGGSPGTADSCIFYLPQEVTLIQTGQIRYSQRIIVNIKLDYMPLKLIQSIDCQDSCSSILQVGIIDGDIGATSIKSSYIASSSFSFAVQIIFDKPYIGKFRLSIGVKKQIGIRYFEPVKVNSKLVIQVNPAYLSLIEEEDSQDILS